MTIQVELDPETEARLAAEAVSRGMALEAYAGQILERAASPYPTVNGKLTREGLSSLTKELQEGSEKMPVLPPEATDRASFYEDRW